MDSPEPESGHVRPTVVKDGKYNLTYTVWTCQTEMASNTTRANQLFNCRATATSETLGPHPDVMTMQEASLRIFCHDAQVAHHDRDVRTFAAVPLDINPQRGATCLVGGAMGEAA